MQAVKADIGAGLAVFLVALPLCLGIALASQAPLSAGLLSGIVGGLIVGALSGSRLSVSGPAAGLTVMVIAGIAASGGFANYLAAVVVAGVIQIGLSQMRAGLLANLFPTSVIQGMLAAIGVVICLKQIPHAIGWDKDAIGDMSFWQVSDGRNTVSEIAVALSNWDPGIFGVFLAAMVAILLWDKYGSRWKIIPAALVGVLVGTGINLLLGFQWQLGAIDQEHYVQLPAIKSLSDLLVLPNFAALTPKLVLFVSLPLALVASIESLLSIEAVDKLDPKRSVTNKNRELLAQGVGNVAAGLIGGLPVTSVIVRSTANLYAGAQSKAATIFHSLLLLVSLLFLVPVLNQIPFAALAAVLIHVGYKLAKPKLFKVMWESGLDQFVPFVATIVGMLMTDLLTGVLIGLAAKLVFIAITTYHSAITVTSDDNRYLIRFIKDATFFNKLKLKDTLARIPDGSSVLLDGSGAMFIDNDIFDVIHDFEKSAKSRNINVAKSNMASKRLALDFKGVRTPNAVL